MIKKLTKLLKEHNIPFNLEKIALHKNNSDNYYSISYNYMGTGIHIPESEIDEIECKEIGIKIWHTWSIKM